MKKISAVYISLFSSPKVSVLGSFIGFIVIFSFTVLITLFLRTQDENSFVWEIDSTILTYAYMVSALYTLLYLTTILFLYPLVAYPKNNTDLYEINKGIFRLMWISYWGYLAVQTIYYMAKIILAEIQGVGGYRQLLSIVETGALPFIAIFIVFLIARLSTSRAL